MKTGDLTNVPLLAAVKRLPAETAAELAALLPALLDRAVSWEAEITTGSKPSVPSTNSSHRVAVRET